MSTIATGGAGRESAPAPVFTGYPYFQTGLCSLLSHILLLPFHEEWPPKRILGLLREQTEANRLHGWLVLGRSTSWHFRPDGPLTRSVSPPPAPFVAHGKLLTSEPIPLYPELAGRRRALEEFDLRLWGGTDAGFLIGDVTKGGRMPYDGEEKRLRGRQSNGVPIGLAACVGCGGWKGECFDTLNTGLVVRVHCRCGNHNLCARCGEPLARHRLDGNHYAPGDGKIWHTPAFAALSHRCQDLQ